MQMKAALNEHYDLNKSGGTMKLEDGRLLLYAEETQKEEAQKLVEKNADESKTKMKAVVKRWAK